MSRNRRRLTAKEIEQEYAVYEEKDVVHKNRLTLVKNKNQLHLNLAEVKPKNFAQTQAFESWYSNRNLVLAGSAGTGKSFISMYLALKEIMEKPNKNLIVIRSAVSVRDVGHLPGDLASKIEQYKQPYKDIASQLFHNSKAWEILEIEGKVNFLCTSFLRGTSLDDSIIIADEVQNFNFAEWNTLMTRIGKNSRLILCGDSRQCDLSYHKNDTSGFSDAMRVLNSMSDFFDIVSFTSHDIVRSPLVKAWITRSEELLGR